MIMYMYKALWRHKGPGLGKFFWGDHKVMGQFSKPNVICIDINIHRHFIINIILMINSTKG